MFDKSHKSLLIAVAALLVSPHAALAARHGHKLPAVSHSCAPFDVSVLRNAHTQVDTAGLVATTYLAGSGFGRDHTAFGQHLAPAGCFPANEMEFQYQFKPEPGFDWARGGKLPGLWIGHGKASGHHHSDTAASARLMWKKNGEVIGYVYPMNGTQNPGLNDHGKARDDGETHGDAVFRGQGLKLVAGQWNDIRVRVKLNGIDNMGRALNDGELEIAINGRALKQTGIQWRRDASAQISHAVIATFFGGPEVSPKTQSAQFRGFAATRLN